MKAMIELNDTIIPMLSEDYTERFRAEYHQCRIRCERLEKMLEHYKNGTLGFMLLCSSKLLETQLNIMLSYKSILEERARLENIEL